MVLTLRDASILVHSPSDHKKKTMKTTPAQASFSEEIQPLSCVVVDDEPLALSLLTSYVERTPFLTLSGAYSSGVEALPALCGEPVDVLFLDIQMPQLTGVELSRMLPATTRVVFLPPTITMPLKVSAPALSTICSNPSVTRTFLKPPDVRSNGLGAPVRAQPISSHRKATVFLYAASTSWCA